MKLTHHMASVPLHVLHIETGKNFYGGALQVLYLIRNLKGKGIKNTLIAPLGSEILKRAMDEGIKCSPTEFSGELDPRLLFRIIYLVKKIKKETRPIIHIHSRRGADLWGVLAGVITNTPYIITRRVDNPELGSLARLKYRRAEKVVAISRAIFNILKAYGIDEERLMLIPSAVDTSIYRPHCERNWFLKEFGIHPSQKTVGMVAQFIPRKGHSYVIEAIPNILRKAPNTKFIFFGQGPLEQEIKRLSQRHGVYDNCIFAGFRKDMHRIFPCLDCLVHPALMEGLGVSVLQAMACRVPVVATNTGGLSDIVEDKKTALLIKRSNMSKDIQDKLLILLNDQNADLKKSIVNNAFKKIHETFSIEKMVDAYVNLYKVVYS
ncbi:Glycosyltransferase [Dissulfuribacter thermophilus]|uniref:Glycosyltransferase n=1 Tax=Dissulfuribacter thermophilus TaxID=1156395 RepID=A0A1B9F523_9BACT|nr:glycosyltransferase family 4 protein [Dissulfuribacter thermophilus]OCC15030.1 Glycosyltransferase [Dissulfuribacter thermophilus]